MNRVNSLTERESLWPLQWLRFGMRFISCVCVCGGSWESGMFRVNICIYVCGLGNMCVCVCVPQLQAMGWDMGWCPETSRKVNSITSSASKPNIGKYLHTLKLIPHNNYLFCVCVFFSSMVIFFDTSYFTIKHLGWPQDHKSLLVVVCFVVLSFADG